MERSARTPDTPVFLHLPNDSDVSDVTRVVDRLLERVRGFDV
jgi:hypothetical protein